MASQSSGTVRAVGRKEEHPCADGFDGFARCSNLVGWQVVEDDDITGPQCRREDLLRIGGEPFPPVIGPSRTIGAVRPVMRNAPVKVVVFQCPCEIGDRLRVPRFAPPAEPCHFRRGDGLIDKDQPFMIEIRLALEPGPPPRAVFFKVIA